MLGDDVPTLAATFLQSHESELVALLTVVVTIVAAIVVDRALLHRGHQLATAVVRDELTPVIDTRLRFMRRLITLTIVVVGLLLALSQFGGLSRLAAGLLASGALLAAIVGFAARQTLANLIAGVMLTITQPLRIGDRVTIEEASGTVEDVRLNYTVVRGSDGGRLFVPNERLAAGILHNDTIVEPTVAVEVELWLPPAADADHALAALATLDPPPVARIAEVAADGVRYTVARGAVAPGERDAQESRLRGDALRALRGAGLLNGA
ncbi:MAG TPA: mechanosensitive ion channel family protein [Conexibacter sp.]|nr:mechanosensitive ion channel family protein [Conexibacter sp.]